MALGSAAEGTEDERRCFWRHWLPPLLSSGGATTVAFDFARGWAEEEAHVLVRRKRYSVFLLSLGSWWCSHRPSRRGGGFLVEQSPLA